MKNKKIGVVGLGRMGSNMARCLKDKGYQIAAVYDVQPDLTPALAVELNAKACHKLSDVTRLSDIILTVVTNDNAMDAIFFGEDNLFTGASDRVFINCATLSPAVHRKVELAAANVGAQCLEACMASSIPQARNGELFLMIGGRKAWYFHLSDR